MWYKNSDFLIFPLFEVIVFQAAQRVEDVFPIDTTRVIAMIYWSYCLIPYLLHWYRWKFAPNLWIEHIKYSDKVTWAVHLLLNSHWRLTTYWGLNKMDAILQNGGGNQATCHYFSRRTLYTFIQYEIQNIQWNDKITHRFYINIQSFSELIRWFLEIGL